MKLIGDIDSNLDFGWKRTIKPRNWITRLLWKFLVIKVDYYMPPSEHVNCRCVYAAIEESGIKNLYPPWMHEMHKKTMKIWRAAIKKHWKD